jgi:hypothetical protein
MVWPDPHLLLQQDQDFVCAFITFEKTTITARQLARTAAGRDRAACGVA